jgi:tetratricopeptide (TPR) repeat protein
VTPRPLIFISAVSRELHSARQLVANTLTFLGYQAVWQDIFGTESGDLRALLRQQIDQCKGVVQLIGKCYGAEPPVPDETFGRVSYTQYEALYARKRGKKVWYLFIDETFPIDVHEPEPEELRELQATYRHRLESDTHIFHPLTSHEALEAGVLKLRNDLTQLRRGVKQWALGVTALVIFVAIATIWLIQMQRRQDVTIQKQGEQVTTIVDRYQKMQQALVRLAEVETQSKQPGSKMSPEDERAAAYKTLEKDLGLPAGSLAKELPAFALELYNRADTTPLIRARAAYALNKFEEAEKLSLESAAQDRQAYETAQRVEEERRKRAIESYTLAGQSAQKRIQYSDAMEHFREAEKLTDRAHNPQEWAGVQHLIGGLLIDHGRYSNAEQILRAVVEVRTYALGAEHPDTLRSRNLFALALVREGKSAEAEAQCREVIKLEEKILGSEHPNTLTTRNNLALALWQQGKYAEAETQNRAAIKSRERALGPEHPDTLTSRHNLALVLNEEGKHVEAEAQYRELIKLYEKVIGPEHPETLKTRGNLAIALWQQGKYAEAEAQYRDVIKIYEKVIGPEHPDTLRTRGNLAGVLGDQGKYAEAEAQYREVITLEEKVIGPEHPETVRNRGNLAEALKRQGKYAEAEAQDRDVIKIQEKILGPEHPNTLATRDSLAEALKKQGKYTDAETEFRAVVKLRTKGLGPEHPDTLLSRDGLASTLCWEGKYAEGEVESRAVIKLSEKVLGPEHPTTLSARDNLSEALRLQSKYGEAEAEDRGLIKIEDKTLGPEHPDTLRSCYHLALCLRDEGKNQEAKEFAGRAVDGGRKVLGLQHPDTKEYEKLLTELEAEH